MQTPVEIINNGHTLRGTLHIPNVPKTKVPMVIFFHGFSATRTEYSFSFVEVSKELEKLGVASVRFDFMGSGESDGELTKMSIETEISDGAAILDYVKLLEFVDTQRIALLGMSFGGLAASVLAGRRCEDVKALCLWAPASIVAKDAHKGFVAGADIRSVLTTGVGELNGLLVGQRFLADLKKLNWQAELKAYKHNCIMIWGENDAIITPEVVQDYENALGERLEKCELSGVGHGFETYEARRQKLDVTLRFLREEL